ncbi:MAG TPA: hypothetical protein VKV20_20295 [Ktedonobacteraceae bacterium]|jgi:hypothetical protein|nr:hypothetical protein [Ktedonobacteraceae bacterium]
MNGTPILTQTQLLLVWTLLGLLLTWLIVFAVLAFRSSPKEKIEPDTMPTPSRSFPVVSAPATLKLMKTSPKPVRAALAPPVMAGVETSHEGGYLQGEA